MTAEKTPQSTSKGSAFILKKMTTERTLEILQTVHKKMTAMTEEELYMHMYKNSPSFREIADTDETINTVRC